MEIPTARSESRRWNLSWVQMRRSGKVLIALVLLAGAFGAGLLTYPLVWNPNHPLGILARYISSRSVASTRWIAASWRADPEELILDIKHKHFEKLLEKRSEAIRLGVLLTSSDDFVPGTLSSKDESRKVRLRLKGDWTDHLVGNKWSFRIRVKGDNTFKGMKQFSLQNPKTRNYLYEWLFHRAMRREDVIALRYDFVRLVVNGKDLGIFALEEHFEKRLIEHNRRRQGPIVRFNERLLWEDRARGLGEDASKEVAYYSSPIDAFKMTSTMKDPQQRRLLLKAISLLERFRLGERTAAEVFDIERLARYYAMSDLLGSFHGMFYHNLRFYYNPVTSKLEPIAFDGHAGTKIEQILEVTENNQKSAYHDFGKQLFADYDFVTAYHRVLARISRRQYLDQLLEEVADELATKSDIVDSEFPDRSFSPDPLYANQQFIRRLLQPVKAIHAWDVSDSDADPSGLTLQVANICPLPVQVMGVQWEGQDRVDLPTPLLLPGKVASDPVQLHTLHIPRRPTAASAESITLPQICHRVLGMDEIMQAEIFAWPPLDLGLPDADVMRLPPNPEAFNFIRIDDPAKKIYILPGAWRVDRDLILPPGFEVIAESGTVLDLVAGTKILSYSPLSWTGSTDAPVIVRSSDSSGQGLAVIGAKEASFLANVVFENLSHPQGIGWALTGAVTFYESPVGMNHCRFVHNRSEDALNIIRGRFTLNHCYFNQTQSDALDADFTDGTLSHCRFTEIGNDAIDVSGSVLQADYIQIDSAGDKGVSAGENSQLALSDVQIRDTEIAFASKDLSKIDLQEAVILNSKLGFVAYQKKPEFGPAEIVGQRVTMKNVERPYLNERRSQIMIDGRAIPASMDLHQVEQILYGVEYGKSSK